MTIDVTIATYGKEGINRVEKMLLPPREGVKYIISWQQHENYKIPPGLESREDVSIYRLDMEGLSNNRNNALKYSTSDIIWIIDDDLILDSDFADKIRTAYQEPNVDVALFKAGFTPEKKYPPKNCKIDVPFPKDYFVSSIEITFKRERIGNLRFYPELGLGSARMLCGEEELFIYSAIKRKLQVRFFNSTLCCHPEPTTGSQISNGILQGQGFVSGVFYPISSWLRIPLKAYRLSKVRKSPLLKSLFHLSKGYFNYLGNWHRIPHCYR